MRRLLSLAILVSPILFVPACGQATRICDLVCECEHCNDLAEDYGCEQISASEEISEIYGCLDEWTKYADCFENEGTCNEEEANYTTREEGNCSATASSGLSCETNSDCLVLGISGARCDNLECVYTACADNGGQPGQPCSGNSDCPGGSDKCEDELTKLSECVNDASDSPGQFVGFGFGFD